jgi:VWFA-related protein
MRLPAAAVLWSVSVIAAASILQAGGAQTPPVRATPEEATDVSAVVVDVVVRDRTGVPVTDLTRDEFAVFEDGVRQELGAFVPIAGASPVADVPPPGALGAPVSPASSGAPEVVAFVFDRLSPEARALATQAALTYVGDGSVAANTTAVFGVDLSLVLYQPFTRDARAIREALQTVAQRATSPFGTSRQVQNAAAAEAQRMQNEVMTATALAGPGQAPDVAAGAATAQFAQMQTRMLRGFESLERDQQGYATSNALLAIVSAMRAIPGRKSLVFFSEGLSIPPNVQQQFVSVIDAANRSNVSIYPMDAAGLRTESTILQTREGVQAAAAATLGRDPSQDVAGRPMMEALERNEDLLRADPQSGLSNLADQTGGFLIANSNDLRSGFTRIDSDMRNYYLLTYVPQNSEYDGKFRNLEVRVARPGLRVSARKGYYAVRPSTSSTPVLSYEAPALAVLERTPLPNAFPVRATALRFPEADRPGLVPVVVNVPLKDVTFAPPEGRPGFTSDLLVLVQFKDDAGQVIDKMSQRYQIEGAAGEEAGARRGDILFYREPILGAGVYTMETVVYDALGDKAAVRIGTVDVADHGADRLRISSVIAVDRSDVVPETDRLPGSPLYVGDRLLYPNLGAPMSKGSRRELAFYFAAYTQTDGGAVTAKLELLSGGTPLAQVPLTLSEPDATGRIAQLGRLPLEPLAPGRYDLIVSVTQHGATASGRLTFRLEP